MGENLELGDRKAVRTPMQWTGEPAAGFSRADTGQLAAPLVQGEFGPEAVNVEAQRADPDSLLNFVRQLISRYRNSPELGWGEFEILPQTGPAVFVHKVSWEDAVLVCVHNFSPEKVTAVLDLGTDRAHCELLDLLGTENSAVDAGGRAEVELGRYGFRWLRVVTPGSRRLR